MSSTSQVRRTSLAWLLLLVIPAALATLLLIPGLGKFSQGLWPEWFLFDQAGQQHYGALAEQVRWWSLGTLVVALLISVAAYLWMRHTWVGRLRTFRVDQVSHYRSFVWTSVQFAFGGCVLLAMLAVVLSESLRAAPPVSWVLFALLVGVLGALQVFVMVRGIETTLRLYRGK